MSKAQELKRKWEAIGPDNRRYVLWAVALFVSFFVMYYFVTSGPETRLSPSEAREAQIREQPVERLFTGANTRDVSLEAISARLRDVERQLSSERERRIAAEAQVTQSLDEGITQAELEARMERVRQEIKDELEEQFSKRQAELNGQMATIGFGDSDVNQAIEGQNGAVEIPSGQANPDESGEPQEEADQEGSEVATLFDRPRQTPVPQAGPQSGQAQNQQQGAQAQRQAAFKVSVAEPADSDENGEQEADQGVSFLPAGSIISGVLITGMDAPTGRQVRSDPFPVTLRVKGEVIMPNRHRMNLAECFIIASGYGELSSERAHLRTETLSCVTDEGEVIQQAIRAYATGPDGRAGVRGRLVTKQGALIVKSMQAGFMQGFAQMFQGQRVPRIATTNNGEDEAIFEQALSTDALQSATLSGAGSALDRVAQFLLDQAADMYPVIEVDAGREIEFIVTTGTRVAVM